MASTGIYVESYDFFSSWIIPILMQNISGYFTFSEEFFEYLEQENGIKYLNIRLFDTNKLHSPTN